MSNTIKNRYFKNENNTPIKEELHFIPASETDKRDKVITLDGEKVFWLGGTFAGELSFDADGNHTVADPYKAPIKKGLTEITKEEHKALVEKAAKDVAASIKKASDAAIKKADARAAALDAIVENN